MHHPVRNSLFIPAGAVVLLSALAAAPAAAQGWSADVLDPTTVGAAQTGAVTPATGLPAAAGQPQNVGLFPMAGAASPPAEAMAQRYVFVRNGQTPAEWPATARGRIALVKLVDPALPATPFALVANNAAVAGAVAVLFISGTTNPTALAAPIPGATILPADGERLVDLIDGTTDAVDPPSGAVSSFPIRINPFVAETGTPAPVPATLTAGAFHGTRVAGGTTPDFPGNPNTVVPFDGPALASAIFPVGREAAEPTLGVNRQGTGFYAAATFDTVGGALPRTLVMRSRDGGRSWQSVTPPLPGPLQSEPPVNGDPMVYVEEDTGRVFSLDTYDADCMWLLMSDDEGQTWKRNPVVCDVTPAVTDHQTIVAGPPPAGSGVLGVLFPEIVYTCYNTVASTNCLRSVDGGQTFTKAGFAFLGVEPENDGPGPHEGIPGLCGGLTAHLRTDRGGRLFLPAGRCGWPGISISEDGGLTWQQVVVNRDIPLPGTEHENTTAIDAADNLYMTWWDENDRLPYLTTSRDHGRTWSAPLMIAPPGVEEVNFPTLDAGDAGRIVVHFPGTVVGDRDDGQRPWNLYQVVAIDALAPDPLFVFTVANEPAEPIHRGPCGPGRCAGMFDFLDIVVPPAGVPAAADGFWATGVDTCNAACEQFGGAAGGMDGIVVRQLAGPSLRARPLLVDDADPGIAYQGDWELAAAAGASGGTYHRIAGVSDDDQGSPPRARLVFDGGAVTVLYGTSSSGGAADVLIDGVPAGTLSFAGTSDEPRFGRAATFGGLGAGWHEVVVEQRVEIGYLDAFRTSPAAGQ